MLVGLAIEVHRDAPLQRERHRGRRARGQRIEHALAEEGSLLEDGDGPTLEHAGGAVGEAPDAERMAVRVGHAAVWREQVEGLARHLPREQHHHRRTAVRDGDRQRQVVARDAALDVDGREGQEVSWRRDRGRRRRRRRWRGCGGWGRRAVVAAPAIARVEDDGEDDRDDAPLGLSGTRGCRKLERRIARRTCREGRFRRHWSWRPSRPGRS